MKMKLVLFLASALVAGLFSVQAHAGPGIAQARELAARITFQDAGEKGEASAGPGIV